MGLEATCTVRYGRQVSQGKALLETNELIFRGEFRLKIPFREIQSADAKGSELHVKSADAVAVFELGAQAEKWALKIRNPKSLLDKLGVKPDSRVAVLGIREESFLEDLTARTADISKRKARKDTDIIFLAAEAPEALEQLGPLQSLIKPNGAIWVVYPKGQKHITEGGVLVAGKAAGLVDVKVAGFSQTHTALKMVIPVNKR
jgi:hypothetical protein